MSFSRQYLRETQRMLEGLDEAVIERMVAMLADTRTQGGRLFILGVGGSAANASHAVNDFRKIAGIEAYAPTDNVSELSARANDEGWASIFEGWLRVSRICADDVLLVFSVGGGDLELNVSPNLVSALDLGRAVGARIIGVVGRNGGYTAHVANLCLVVPSPNKETVTSHTEECQAIVWHLLVSHPLLKKHPTRWESLP